MASLHMALYIPLVAIWQYVSQLLAKPREDTRSACRRHEQPCLIADDLGKTALRLVPVKPRRRPTGKLEPLSPVDQAALEGERLAALDLHRPATGEHSVDDLLGRERMFVFQTQGLAEFGNAVEWHFATQ